MTRGIHLHTSSICMIFRHAPTVHATVEVTRHVESFQSSLVQKHFCLSLLIENNKQDTVLYQ